VSPSLPRTWFRRGIAGLVVVAVAIATWIAVRGCAERKARVAPLSTAPVERRDITVTVEATGTVEPINLIEVKSKASGQIIRMPVEVGSAVRPGQLLAEIDKVDVQNQYDQAAAEYERFLELHPVHRWAPHAQFKLALCHAHRMGKVGRDPTMAEKTKAAFERVLSYSGTRYEEVARAKLAEVNRYLAQADVSVGRYYFKQGRYPAAIERFRRVADQKLGGAVGEDAAYWLAVAYERDGQTAQAADRPARCSTRFRRVATRNPSSGSEPGSPPVRADPRYYPLALDLRDRRVVVIGGGPVATRKAAELLKAGARLTVVSPTVSARLARWAREGRLLHRARGYRRGDLRGACLAVAATSMPEEHKKIAVEARGTATWLNVVDEPALCDFIAPAVIRRGDLTIAISTGGTNPALARRLKRTLEHLIGEEYGRATRLLGAVRVACGRRDIPSVRSRIVDRLMASALMTHLRRGDRQGVLRTVRRITGLPTLTIPRLAAR
jgi:precorrin-2 dehydrogenase/sirohydrochlorin ferrochelatase